MENSLLFVMLAAAIASLAAVIYTSIGTVFLDSVLKKDELTERMPQWLMPVILIMLLVAVISGTASVIKAVLLVKIRGKTAVVSSSRFFRHLLHLPVGFYEQRSVGDLQMRQNDNETIVYTLVGQLAPVLINSMMLIFYLTVMLKYSVLLTAVGVVTVVLNALTAHYISKKRINVTRTLTSDSGKLYAATMGGIEMIETIKATGAENGFFTKWSGYQALVSNGNVKMMRINFFLGLIPEALTRIADIIVLVLGILLILRGKSTPGYLLSFTGLLAAFMDPVTRIIDLGQTVQEIQTDMARIEDVMRYPEDTDAAPESVPECMPKKLSGKLDLEHVSFGYSPLEPPLIEDLSLHLEPGKWVALVGASGSGKSTAAKLITGLYQPRSGEILFDGIPIQNIPSRVLRGSVAMVDQFTATFNDTVADNITLWDKSIEDFELILACRDAEIHEEIAARPGNYQEMIQPGGRNFSGGQLQRLMIARAVCGNPKILIMDEATSALDNITQKHVIDSLESLHCTRIVIAHRLSTVQHCDRILVLNGGKIAEQGTYEELMEKDGLFADLVARQKV